MQLYIDGRYSGEEQVTGNETKVRKRLLSYVYDRNDRKPVTTAEIKTIRTHHEEGEIKAVTTVEEIINFSRPVVDKKKKRNNI